jgi:hypothetical protein
MSLHGFFGHIMGSSHGQKFQIFLYRVDLIFFWKNAIYFVYLEYYIFCILYILYFSSCAMISKVYRISFDIVKRSPY